jgi:hypothetical protein
MSVATPRAATVLIARTGRRDMEQTPCVVEMSRFVTRRTLTTAEPGIRAVRGAKTAEPQESGNRGFGERQQWGDDPVS